MQTKELAKELIGYETVSPIKDSEIFQFVQMYLEDRGIESKIHESQDVKSLTASIGSGRPHICLNGHLDVVEPGSGWEVTDPFTPREKNGRIYGRGATDMKGGVAAMINSLVDLSESDFGGKITLMLAGDEEIGGYNGSGQLVQDQNFDFAILAEPTDLNIQTGTRGAMWLDVVLKGESCHASRPGEAENVLTKLPDVLNALEDLEMSYESDGSLPEPTAAISAVESDETYNKIPDEVRIAMDVRYVPGQSVETVLNDIRQALSQIDVDFSLEPEPLEKDKRTIEPTKLVHPGFKQALTESVEEVVGRTPDHITEGGSSDGRFFGRQGTPFVELGLNQEMIHRSDEYCDVEHLKQLREIFNEVCLKLDGEEALDAGTSRTIRKL